MTEALERVADAEVTSDERIGIAERAHRDVRGGPRADPREGEQCPLRGGAVGARVERHAAIRERGGEAEQRCGPGTWHGKGRGVHGRDRGRGREAVGEAAVRGWERLAERVHHAPGERAGARDRHLLAEHGADRELGTVDVAWDPDAGGGVDEVGDPRVAKEVLVDGDRVGIEVEQAPAALDRRSEVGDVGEAQRAAHVVAAVDEGHGPGAVGQVEDPAVSAVDDVLHAGHGAVAEEREDGCRVERLAGSEAQRDRARR